MDVQNSILVEKWRHDDLQRSLLLKKGLVASRVVEKGPTSVVLPLYPVLCTLRTVLYSTTPYRTILLLHETTLHYAKRHNSLTDLLETKNASGDRSIEV